LKEEHNFPPGARLIKERLGDTEIIVKYAFQFLDELVFEQLIFSNT